MDAVDVEGIRASDSNRRAGSPHPHLLSAPDFRGLHTHREGWVLRRQPVLRPPGIVGV